MVMSGREKGKKGKILAVSPEEGKVIIEGLNIMTKHQKPRGQGRVGGIIKAEGAMYACKVMHYCQRCNKPVRIGRAMQNGGEKLRVCKKCGEVI